MSLNRVYDTLNFVETNYNKQISIKELENVSCYSYRNIQRIFKYTCNETIGAYQKRLRLENAYKMILYTKENLSQIAFEVGFETVAAFSKAFKQYFGVSPKEAKSKKEFLFKSNSIIPTTSSTQLKFEIVYLPSLKVYYKSTNTNYVNEEIELLWQEFESNNFQSNNVEYYGVIADDPLITEKIKCRYDACSSVQSLNEKLPHKNIFGGKYVKFIHHGSYDSIEETYKNIYGGWILSSRLEFDSSPIIEHYISHSSNTKNKQDFSTEILIPLKK